jgi:hypothetical protein
MVQAKEKARASSAENNPVSFGNSKNLMKITTKFAPYET